MQDLLDDVDDGVAVLDRLAADKDVAHGVHVAVSGLSTGFWMEWGHSHARRPAVRARNDGAS
ncbi:MAG TPA: hypothetical protein VLT45_24575, partial [Kofleriaceae bacterium]|nr:hypothetical protein [Kofleriaceae bacterium]